MMELDGLSLPMDSKRVKERVRERGGRGGRGRGGSDGT